MAAALDYQCGVDERGADVEPVGAGKAAVAGSPECAFVRVFTDHRGLCPRAEDGSWVFAHSGVRLLLSRPHPVPDRRGYAYINIWAEPLAPLHAFNWQLLVNIWVETRWDLRSLVAYRVDLIPSLPQPQSLVFPSSAILPDAFPRLDLHLTFLRKEEFLLPNFAHPRHPDDSPVLFREPGDPDHKRFFVNKSILLQQCGPGSRLASHLLEVEDWSREFGSSAELELILHHLYPSRLPITRFNCASLGKLAVDLRLPFLRRRVGSFLEAQSEAPLSWKILVADKAGLWDTLSRVADAGHWEAEELVRGGIDAVMSPKGNLVLLQTLARGQTVKGIEGPALLSHHRGQNPLSIQCSDGTFEVNRAWLFELCPKLRENPLSTSVLTMDCPVSVVKAILDASLGQLSEAFTTNPELALALVEQCKALGASQVMWAVEDRLVGALETTEGPVAAGTLVRLLSLAEKGGLGRLLRALASRVVDGETLEAVRAEPGYEALGQRTKMGVMEAAVMGTEAEGLLHRTQPEPDYSPVFHPPTQPHSTS